MKLKLMILITGTLLGVAYLVGCGGGGNNNNNGNCQAGYTWNGSSCVYGAAGAYGVQGNCAATPGTIWSTQVSSCVQQCNLGNSIGGIINGQCQYVPPTCGGGGGYPTPYGGGYGGAGYGGGYAGGYSGGYSGGYAGGAGCGGGGPGYGPGGPGYGPGYGPYPIQYPYNYYPTGNQIYWGISFH